MRFLHIIIKYLGIIVTLLFGFMQCTIQQSPTQITQNHKTLENFQNRELEAYNQILCEPSTFVYQDSMSIINNQWGKYKIKKGALKLCIKDSKYRPSWDWEMPTKNYGVIAYPAIFYGSTIWGKDSVLKPLTKIANIKEFTVEYNSNLIAPKSKYNLAFDIWISRSNYSLLTDLDTELMIWEDYQKFSSGGKYIQDITTSEGVYKLYVGKINRKELNIKWTYIALVRKNPRISGKVPIKEILEKLDRLGYLSNQKYLSSIEFGTELSTMKGIFEILKYRINLKY